MHVSPSFRHKHTHTHARTVTLRPEQHASQNASLCLVSGLLAGAGATNDVASLARQLRRKAGAGRCSCHWPSQQTGALLQADCPGCPGSRVCRIAPSCGTAVSWSPSRGQYDGPLAHTFAAIVGYLLTSASTRTRLSFRCLPSLSHLVLAALLASWRETNMQGGCGGFPSAASCPELPLRQRMDGPI